MPLTLRSPFRYPLLPRSILCISLSVLIPSAFVVPMLASDYSYKLLAGAGILTAVLLPICFVVGAVVLAIELLTHRLHAIVWPALLLLISGVPLLLVLFVAATTKS